MLGEPHPSRSTEKINPRKGLESCRREDPRQSPQKIQSCKGEAIVPVDALESDATNNGARRRIRRLSCLSLRSWKHSGQSSSDDMQSRTSGAKEVQDKVNKTQQESEKRTQQPWENDGRLKRSAMRFISDAKAWLLRSQSEKLIEPYPAQRQSVIPIRTSASRFQSLRLPVNGSGAAARQSAAARNSALLQCPAGDAFDLFSDYPPSYEKIDTRSSLVGQSLTQDVESGVNLETHQHNLVMKDDMHLVVHPFLSLPPELTASILSHLDAVSLARAELVSQTWARDARQSYAWREVFRNETQKERHNSMVPSNQYSIEGAGLGTLSPNQNFKSMLRARRELKGRWRKGKASAIYLEGHTDSVYCVQFDERKIITGSRDRTIRIWDTRNYRCIKILGTPNKSSVSNRLPIQTYDEGQLGRPQRIFIPPQTVIQSSSAIPETHHSGSVLCLQYDDDILVSGSSDSTCIVWDIKDDYRPLRRLRSHATGVLDICFDKDHIVSCSKDTTICLWNRHTGERLRQLNGHRGPVNAVQLRGDLIVSASGDGVAKLWKLSSGQCIKEFASKDRGMACVDFSLDSRMILAGGNDQIVYQFDTSSGKTVQEMAGHSGLVRSLHLDNTNGRVVSGSYDTNVRVYDFATGELIAALEHWTTSWILSAKSDYRRIIAASQDSRIVIMDFGYGVPNIESLAT